MVEVFPRHDFLTEHLRGSLTRSWIVTQVTHVGNPRKVAGHIYSQNLDCDLTSFVITPPHIGEPTLIRWSIRPIATNWYLHGSWKQTLMTAYFTQKVQTPFPKLRC